MIILVLCITFFVLSFIKYILHVQHMESYVKNMKSISPRLPLIGNISLFMGKSMQHIYEDVVEVILRNSTPIKAQLGPAYFVIVDNPEDMKTVLTSTQCFDKPYPYDFFHLKSGILTQRSGQLWRPIRKLMNPMFSLKRLQSFLPILNYKSTLILKDLENEIGKPHFDVMHYTSTCTLSAVCSTIMGIDVDTQPDKGAQYLNSLSHIYDITMTRFAKPWIHLEFFYRLTNLYKEEKAHWKIMRQLSNCVFNNKKNEYLATNNNTKIDDSYGDFDEHHLKADFPLMPPCLEGQFSEEMVKQQIDVLLIAGHETTASTIAYVILMLAMHPNIQEQVFDELRSSYDAQDQETTYEKMLSLHLLDRVIKETTRLFPVVFGFSRTPAVDIPLTNCVVPKGVSIILPVYTTHRRRDIWGDNAEEFDPDHFLPENVQNRHPFAFLPFSTGPRNCIGYQYAMFTMKVMLSSILRHFKFNTKLAMRDLRPKFEVTLRLTNKHMVGVERRTW